MSLRRKAWEEVKSLALLTLYFSAWVAALVITKKLVLADYNIEFYGLSLAVVGVLVIAKAVLVLQHVPLWPWVRRQPPAVDVLLRTALYVIGVAAAMLLEKAFEARHEFGGFGRALAGVLRHRDIYHIYVNSMWLTFALLVYNGVSVLRKKIGDHELKRLFFSFPGRKGLRP